VGGHQHNGLVQLDPGDDANAIPGYTTPERTDFPIEQTTHELRLASNNNAFWDWMVGAYYAHTSGQGTYVTTSDTLVVGLPDLVYRVDLLIGLTAKSTDKAIFTWHRFKPAEGLRGRSRRAIRDNQHSQPKSDHRDCSGLPPLHV
jgi:iron complex outermembrane recepter protein